MGMFDKKIVEETKPVSVMEEAYNKLVAECDEEGCLYYEGVNECFKMCDLQLSEARTHILFTMYTVNPDGSECKTLDAAEDKVDVKYFFYDAQTPKIDKARYEEFIAERRKGYYTDFETLDLNSDWYYFGNMFTDGGEALYKIKIDAKYSVKDKNYIAYSYANYVYTPHQFCRASVMEWNFFKERYTPGVPDFLAVNENVQ